VCQLPFRILASRRLAGPIIWYCDADCVRCLSHSLPHWVSTTPMHPSLVTVLRIEPRAVGVPCGMLHCPRWTIACRTMSIESTYVQHPCAQTMSTLWPHCVHPVAKLCPPCGQIVSTLWPNCVHLVAKLCPPCCPAVSAGRPGPRLCPPGVMVGV
jgi:hypothetical protein